MRVLSVDPGSANFAWCVLRVGEKRGAKWDEAGKWEILKWEVCDVGERESWKVIKALIAKFEKEGETYDMILIEDQVRATATMKCIAAGLFAYFITKDGDAKIKKCRTGKLKVYDGPPCWKPYKVSKNKRKARKQLAERHCGAILSAVGMKMEAFDAARKKDDMADALLQALFWLGGRTSTKTKCLITV